MATTLNPTGSRIIAVRHEAETQTASGIYLGDVKKQERPVIATVQSSGPDVLSIEAGDVIVYKEYAATEFEHDGEKLLIMSEDDVLAIVSDGEE